MAHQSERECTLDACAVAKTRRPNFCKCHKRGSTSPGRPCRPQYFAAGATNLSVPKICSHQHQQHCLAHRGWKINPRHRLTAYLSRHFHSCSCCRSRFSQPLVGREEFPDVDREVAVGPGCAKARVAQSLAPFRGQQQQLCGAQRLTLFERRLIRGCGAAHG